jgi:hypothetical protein
MLHGFKTFRLFTRWNRNEKWFEAGPEKRIGSGVRVVRGNMAVGDDGAPLPQLQPVALAAQAGELAAADLDLVAPIPQGYFDDAHWFRMAGCSGAVKVLSHLEILPIIARRFNLAHQKMSFAMPQAHYLLGS